MNLADRWHSAILKNSLDLMRYEAGLRTEILAMLTQLGRELVANWPRPAWTRPAQTGSGPGCGPCWRAPRSGSGRGSATSRTTTR